MCQIAVTWKQASVANSLAIEQRDTAFGADSSNALAAVRTNKRDATRLLAISATLNCRCCGRYDMLYLSHTHTHMETHAIYIHVCTHTPEN